MPCYGCNDKPAIADPSAFHPRTLKVWLGARYAAEAALRGPQFDTAVKSRAQQQGIPGSTVLIVETAWLDLCRALYPIPSPPSSPQPMA